MNNLDILQLWEEKEDDEEVEVVRITESNRDHRPSLAEADAEYDRLCQARKAQVANTNTNTKSNTNTNTKPLLMLSLRR